jgi:hypothetical protein
MATSITQDVFAHNRGRVTPRGHGGQGRVEVVEKATSLPLRIGHLHENCVVPRTYGPERVGVF